MPVEVRIDREQRMVHATFEGVLSVEDMRQYLAGTWATGLLAGYSELADLRGVDSSQLSSGRILELAQAAPEMGIAHRPARLALVVRQEDQLGKASFFGSARDILRPNAGAFRTFFSLEEAQEWLADPTSATAPDADEEPLAAGRVTPVP